MRMGRIVPTAVNHYFCPEQPLLGTIQRNVHFTVDEKQHHQRLTVSSMSLALEYVAVCQNNIT